MNKFNYCVFLKITVKLTKNTLFKTLDIMHKSTEECIDGSLVFLDLRSYQSRENVLLYKISPILYFDLLILIPNFNLPSTLII
ncbi:hypothetical protein BpHYR1_019658 [Brachionus plicatilis]|uniref:Uncharacterized protein n=1 Tax=Brachionus plicatilis TaxID=10195 RepID=A0A3M7SPT7_BRAPC|nr:hypothetical protein BpHYR1_019658 [Brachionus plicatilis]